MLGLACHARAQTGLFYTRDELVGTQVLAVTNYLPKQVVPFISEVLVTGFVQENGAVIFARPNKLTPNGSMLA
jgi:tRNA-binding protein